MDRMRKTKLGDLAGKVPKTMVKKTTKKLVPKKTVKTEMLPLKENWEEK
eukprot:gene15851-11344_t